MAQRRLQLQTILEGLLGSRNVYFQPTDNTHMKYPAIVYNRDYSATQFADNRLYFMKKRYQVTVIDRDPDSDIPDKVEHLPLTTFVRHYVVDGLNHDIYNIYF